MSPISLVARPLAVPDAGVGNDPWWVVVLKVLIIFVFLIVLTLFNIWWERRVVARMQHRIGVHDGDELVVSTDAGSIRLPVLITQMTDNVVWLPTNSADSHVRRSLHADHGSIVTIAGGNS